METGLQGETVIFVKYEQRTTKVTMSSFPQPFHRAVRACRNDCAATVFFMAGYKKVRVYTEKIQVTRGLFHSKALHSKYKYLRSFPLSQEAY